MPLTICPECNGIGRYENDEGEIIYCEYCGGDGAIEYDY